VKDGGQTVLLDPTTLEITRPSHVALMGTGTGRDALLRALGRQTSDVRGRLQFDTLPLLARSGG
jgi:ABC-type transporter Mla maintaining outer membrane lipid asymmetry ATPase subunit MlaF